MRSAVIVSAARTAVGKAPNGSLKTVRPDEMAATVIGEALSNVGRHAAATRVDVRVSVDTKTRTLVAVIEDNGIGPGADDVPGQGTVNLATRARLLGGTSTLRPGDRGGAVLTWSIPMELPR